MKSFLSKTGYNTVKIFFALRAQRKDTINSFLSKKGYGKSFLSKRGYNKVKKLFALRAQRKGTIESFLSKQKVQ